MRTDLHQHLLAEPLVAALARRTSAPFVTAEQGGYTLRLAGEQPWPLAVDDPAARAELIGADGLDRGFVALSAALGIESLPVDEADVLLDAYAQTSRALPAAFGAWGALPLTDPDPRRVDALLDEGFAGLCLPAGALSEPAALDRIGPALEALARRDAPLFVHPGPVVKQAAGAPAWWPAATDYVAGLQAAWFTWIARGRYEHPTLRVLFAALAGLAPLQAERLVTRGGPHPGRDAYLFYDTSSYGPVAIASMRAAVGAGQLVYGSDRPVVEPLLPDEDDLVVANPQRLLGVAQR
jgi:hypothetical protein